MASLIANVKSHIFLTFANQDQKPFFMLRVIAIFILIYLIFRVVITFIVPWIARWYLNRFKKRFYRDNPWAAEAEAKRKAQYRKYQESQKNRKPDTDQLGEYVDYEEIDD